MPFRSSYATPPMLGFEPDKVKALLGRPAHVRIPALVSIGFRPRKDFAPIVFRPTRSYTFAESRTVRAFALIDH